MIIQRVVELAKETPAIVSLLDDRVYPIEWPDAPTFPLAVVQRASGLGETDMQGDAGIESARVQIDVYHDQGLAACVAVAMEFRRLLHGFRGGPLSAPCAIDRSACINMADLPVPEMARGGPRLRRRMLEFMIWNREV